MLWIILMLTAAAAPPAPPEKGATAQPIPRAQFISEMDSQFRQMDADKNGQLTHAEIEQFQEQSALAEAKARNRAQVAELDKDKNGQISPTEFGKLIAPTPAANSLSMLIREDGNRDNQISLIEHRTATVANFDRLDTDKDGVVTATEMKAGGIGR